MPSWIEVQEIHARRQGVPAGDADDEAEVGPDEPVLGLRGGRGGPAQVGALLAGGEALSGLAPGLDDAREFFLLVGSEQRHLADLVEVQADRIIHDRW